MSCPAQFSHVEQGRALSLAEGTEALSSRVKSLVARAAVQKLGTVLTDLSHCVCCCALVSTSRSFPQTAFSSPGICSVKTCPSQEHSLRPSHTCEPLYLLLQKSERSSSLPPTQAEAELGAG